MNDAARAILLDAAKRGHKQVTGANDGLRWSFRTIAQRVGR